MASMNDDPDVMACTNGLPIPASGPPGESEVARQRREQVVEAAMEIIATRGLHELSLKEIEKKTGMARGHLTYYFRHKEDILLAVFDRMLDRMIAQTIQAMRAEGPKPYSGQPWECLRFMLDRNLKPHTPEQEAFGSVLHTFLAQIHYRDDYRAKLAERNGEWRTHLATDFATNRLGPPVVPPVVLASIVMSLVQGLAQQLAVNPDAFDRRQMYDALLTMLAPLFRTEHSPAPEPPTGEI
jgi:AcrR family transcriptional regulator